ncbi:TPA_asm: hypothetical protein vir519_00045 [Caudoviricetes sp. vir519]|nr:TPA_asm: hypothetical protein vir519_00045 [Caudoviricetes sp. vir519]
MTMRLKISKQNIPTGPVQRTIYEYVQKNPGCTSTEIASMLVDPLGIEFDSVVRRVGEMRRKGGFLEEFEDDGNAKVEES